MGVINWGNCDFGQLSAMQARLNALEKGETDQFFRSCSRVLAARLLSLVIPRTPVGRKPRILTAAPKAVKSVGVSGKTRSFASRENMILQRYWSGYAGGTLRRGWTAKSEAEAKAGKGANGKNVSAYAESLPVQRKGRNFKITVQNPVSYASYVEHGHRQTKGRYVPMLGRRLVRGIVPGRHMLLHAEQDLSRAAPALLERKLQQFLEEAIR